MKNRSRLIRKITNLLGITFITLGMIPVPVLSQIGSVYAQVEDGAAAVDLPAFVSYTELLGSTSVELDTVEMVVGLPEISGVHGDWISLAILGPVLADDGPDVVPTEEPAAEEPPAKKDKKPPVVKKNPPQKKVEAPPAEVSPVEAPPAEAPPAEAPPAEEEAVVEEPAAEATPAEEPAAEEPAAEEPVCEGEECAPEAEELPVEEPVCEGEECAPEPVGESVAEEEVVAEIIAAAAENEIVLVDDSGDSLNMACQETADLLAEGDPVIIRGGITYNFLPLGSTCVPTSINVCDLSATPLSKAVAFANPNEIIMIAAGTYDENVLVDKNVILTGGSGGVNVTSFTLSAPIPSLASWTNIITDLVYVITDTAPDPDIQGSIQDGIDIVAPGGVVNVGEGTYEENVTIDKPVTITGDVGSPTLYGAGSNAPILRYLSSYQSGTGFTIGTFDNTLGVTIQGIFLYGLEFGVNVNGQSNVNLNNNSFFGLPSSANAIINEATDTINLYNIEFYGEDNSGNGYNNDCTDSPNCIKEDGILETDAVNIPEVGDTFSHAADVIIIKAGNAEYYLTRDNSQCGSCNDSSLPYCVDWGETSQTVYRCGSGPTVKAISNIQFWKNTETPDTYCGDSIIQAGAPRYEQCDLGVLNGVLNSGCSADCKTETPDTYCGDSIIQAGAPRYEQCDLGVLNGVLNSGCSADCKTETPDPYCGDGIVQAGEECDDGNKNNSDGCRNDCTLPKTTTTTTTVVVAPLPLFIIPVTGQFPIITAGIGHTCALTVKEGLECWGLNESGQVGDRTFDDTLVPVDVVDIDPTTVIGLVSGIHHTCVLTSANEVFCWGLNSSGQLGDGTTENSNVPLYVDGLKGKIIAISAGAEFTCALNSANDVFCWGNNSSGQLNDGTEEHSSVPVKTTTVSNPVLISGGSAELQGITPDGAVQLWNSQPIIPVTGFPEDNNSFVSADRFTEGGCSMTNTGDVNCWGGIINAQVKGAVVNDMLSSGKGHACTMKPEGLVCWGSNSNGQLGDDSTDDSDEEVFVVELEQGVIALAAGMKHTCVIYTDEDIACWGLNDYGQLGNDTIDDNMVPVNTK